MVSLSPADGFTCGKAFGLMWQADDAASNHSVSAFLSIRVDVLSTQLKCFDGFAGGWLGKNWVGGWGIMSSKVEI